MDNNDAKKIIAKHISPLGAELFAKLLRQKPLKADAIVYLQGDRLDRAPMVEDLYRRGFAKYIVISGNNQLVGEGKRAQENDIHLSSIKKYFLSRKINEKAIIIDDKSLNTLDQAKNMIKLAKEMKWLELIVATSPYHLLRAFLTFIKQARDYDWQGRLIMTTPSLSWLKVPSGRLKTNIEMLVVEAEKIKKYRNDLATIEYGMKYFGLSNKKAL